MWGHANVLDRQSGYRIYQNFITDKIQSEFNPGQTKNLKGYDQFYLTQHVWPMAKQNATMHDSYNCQVYGGDPFPTQRPTDRYCFVTCFFPCCDLKHNQTARMPECPLECRPKDHPEWTTC